MGARALPVRMVIAAAVTALAGGCHKQAAETPQPAPAGASAAAAPVTRASPLAVVTDNAGKAPPKSPFTDLATGKPVDLTAFKGKPLLVNLWATWCGPCVRELPALDALARSDAGRLQVVAVSEDMEGAKVVPPFLQAHGIRTLGHYHDPNNALMTELKEASLPVSVLYDAQGKELWRVPGDLDWGGAKAKELLAKAGV